MSVGIYRRLRRYIVVVACSLPYYSHRYDMLDVSSSRPGDRARWIKTYFVTWDINNGNNQAPREATEPGKGRPVQCDNFRSPKPINLHQQCPPHAYAMRRNITQSNTKSNVATRRL